MLYVACCTNMAVLRQKEARSREYALLLSNSFKDLFIVQSTIDSTTQYTLQVFEHFEAVYMHKLRWQTYDPARIRTRYLWVPHHSWNDVLEPMNWQWNSVAFKISIISWHAFILFFSGCWGLLDDRIRHTHVNMPPEESALFVMYCFIGRCRPSAYFTSKRHEFLACLACFHFPLSETGHLRTEFTVDPVSSTHETFTQCWFVVGPASQTLDQQQTSIGWNRPTRISIVYWYIRL